MRKPQLPFILRKRSDKGGIYYVSFRSSLDKSNAIVATRSTGTRNKGEALEIAFGWYRDGIPSKSEKKQDKTISQLSVIGAVRQDKLTADTVDDLVRELEKITGDKFKRVQKNDKGAVDAYQFALDFWDWDKSPYIREKLRKSHRIGKPHALAQQSNIRRFWKTRLSGRMLCEITKQDIWDFMDEQEDAPGCFQTKNDRIRAFTTALGWAYQHEYIDKDISKGFVFFSGSYGERQILTPEMAQALFSFEWDDERAMLANAVAMCTGMRAHEIASLQLKDLGDGRLYVRHSWNAKDGLKPTKNGEARTALLPFPQITDALRRLGESNPYGEGLDGFIFYASVPGKPLEIRSFLKGLRRALVRIGVPEQTARKYTFHSWRHYFATYMKGKVDDKALQLQTGHKDIEMLEHYAGHRTGRDDESIERAQESVFGAAVDAMPALSFDRRGLYAQIKTDYMDKGGIYEHSRQDRKNS